MDSECLQEGDKEKYADQLNVLSLEEVVKEGDKKLPWANVTKDTIYAFSYTSGTTGTPKGAMISHENICSVIGSSGTVLKFTDNERILSYLPMAHIIERVLFNVSIAFNVKVGVFSGVRELLMEDI